MSTRFTVLVPAHDEEAVIGRLLAALAPPSGREAEMDVIVLCNACADNSADVAREAMPAARIVEISHPGKANAINQGLKLANGGPVFVVDADIVVGFHTLECLADILRDGSIMVASPMARIDTSSSSGAVRAYYRIWQLLPYLRSGVGGSGVYGLSQKAAMQINPLPLIIADDSYVRRSFHAAELARITTLPDGQPVFTTVFAPANLPALIRVEARRRAGDAQLAQFQLMQPSGMGISLFNLPRQLDATASWLDLFVYMAVKFAGRVLYRLNRLLGRADIWWRDDSSRKSLG